jgi:hypothetical protein
MPTKSFLKHFRDDFVKAVENGGSPVYKARASRIKARAHGHGQAKAHAGAGA